MDLQYMNKVPDLRKKFLEKHYSADKNYYDTRDISRIKSDDLFVLQYLNAKKGNVDKAYKLMDEAMKWRHSFGVNDITENDLDQEIVNSGLVIIGGRDKKGTQMYLCEGRKYIWKKKNKQKSEGYRKYWVYLFEKHQREYPNEKLTLVTDCEGVSLSEHDSDTDKFFSHMLAKYYPDILEKSIILHFSPIFQALWKAVQILLGDIAKKYVFPKNDEVFNYIDKDQLPVAMGGEA